MRVQIDQSWHHQLAGRVDLRTSIFPCRLDQGLNASILDDHISFGVDTPGRIQYPAMSHNQFSRVIRSH